MSSNNLGAPVQDIAVEGNQPPPQGCYLEGDPSFLNWGIVATGTTFPNDYRGLMFVALHGSWNREPKSGYKVITVNPETGEVRDFLTGFLNGAVTTARPVGLQVTPDGALLLTDDGNGLIYRVAYTGR